MKTIQYEIRCYYGKSYDVIATLDEIPTQQSYDYRCSWAGKWKLVKVTKFESEVKPLKTIEVEN